MRCAATAVVNNRYLREDFPTQLPNYDKTALFTTKGGLTIKKLLSILLAIALLLSLSACLSRDDFVEPEIILIEPISEVQSETPEEKLQAAEDEEDEDASEVEPPVLSETQKKLSEISAVAEVVDIAKDGAYTATVTLHKGYQLEDIQEIFYQIQSCIPYDESEPDSYGYTQKKYHPAVLLINDHRGRLLYEYQASYGTYGDMGEDYFWQAMHCPEGESIFYPLFFDNKAERRKGTNYDGVRDLSFINGQEIFNATKDLSFTESQLGIKKYDSIRLVYDSLGEPNDVKVRYATGFNDIPYNDFIIYAEYDFGYILFAYHCAYIIHVTSTDAIGPRGLQVGDTYEKALSLFPQDAALSSEIDEYGTIFLYKLTDDAYTFAYMRIDEDTKNGWIYFSDALAVLMLKIEDGVIVDIVVTTGMC